MPAGRSPSLQDIADATGYSLMTVSRAIRGTGAVSEKALKAIQKEAARIGYQHNPQITRMMSMMRGGRRSQYHETLAMIWFCEPGLLKTNPSLKRLSMGATSRGQKLGFHIDFLFYGDYDKNPMRLCNVLDSRGIRGVILGPVIGRHQQSLIKMDFDWQKFSWVAFGNTQTNQEFNRVGHHHFFGMELLLQKLAEKGYKRPALCISEGLDKTAHKAYSGAFLSHHPLSFSAARSMIFPVKLTPEKLPGWLEKNKADVVITVDVPLVRRVLTRANPKRWEKTGLVSLHVLDDNTVSGIDQSTDVLGSYAVDMAVAQIHRGDFGLPDEPKLLLNKGRWNEGSTI